jgi:hypothetical protein
MASSKEPKHGRRAIGIVRVSRVSGRVGESLTASVPSPTRLEE